MGVHRLDFMGLYQHCPNYEAIKEILASAGNRTRVSSMATMNSTTRPLMRYQQPNPQTPHKLPSGSFLCVYNRIADPGFDPGIYGL